MLQYFDELKSVLEKYSLSSEDVIIVGSSAITFCGGRINNDIDFTVRKSAYKKLPLKARFKLFFVDHVDLSENVDLFHGRYMCLGVMDEQMFMADGVNEYGGIKVIRPEYEYAYKIKKNREKDNIDIQCIQNNIQLRDCFDWNMVQKLEKKSLKMVICCWSLFLKKCVWKVLSKFIAFV